MHPPTTAGENEVTILARVLVNGQEGPAPELARRLLELRFSEGDKARMNELAARNREGTLSDAERDELLGYAKAGCLLGILHSRARRALKKRRTGTKPH